jgi:hypothetical protein
VRVAFGLGVLFLDNWRFAAPHAEGSGGMSRDLEAENAELQAEVRRLRERLDEGVELMRLMHALKPGEYCACSVCDFIADGPVVRIGWVES